MRQKPCITRRSHDSWSQRIVLPGPWYRSELLMSWNWRLIYALAILLVGIFSHDFCDRCSADEAVAAAEESETSSSRLPPPEAAWPAGEHWPRGLFGARVSASPLLLSGVDELTAGGRAAFRKISEASARLGRMPTYREFMRELTEFSQPLPRDDWAALFWTFSRAQQPEYQRAELVALTRDWDRQVQSLDLRYEVRVHGGIRDGMKTANRFAIDGSRILWDQTVLVPRRGQKVERHVQSYDGTLYRDVRTFGQENVDGWSRGRNVIGRIQPLDTLVRFHDYFNPLVMQGILDSGRRFDIQGESLADLIAEWTIFETLDTINGIECVCVGNEIRTWYLSPRHGMALVAVREGYFDFDDDTGRMIVDSSHFEQNAEDFYFLADDALWVPGKIHRIATRGTETTITEVMISALTMNQNVQPGDFSDIIPPNALVTEPGRPRAHRAAPRASAH